ncbi:hypothetical protein K32_49840 [Kaistia sp. 32K]|nr:hypothetical protein K32_49840 [Kaistia sp. 32K]
MMIAETGIAMAACQPSPRAPRHTTLRRHPREGGDPYSRAPSRLNLPRPQLNGSRLGGRDNGEREATAGAKLPQETEPAPTFQTARRHTLHRHPREGGDPYSRAASRLTS